MENVLIILIALLIDIAFAEPPNKWHPVAWLGKAISLEVEGAPKGAKAQLIYGIGMVVISVGIFTTLAYFLLAYLKQLNLIAYILTAAALLKFTFSLCGLKQAAIKVRQFLAQDNLEQARSQLRSLVSRNPTPLTKQQAISATVESVAENSCDSFVAPLFYFLFLGVPGAVAYRIVNTFDAMVGYHGEWEYLGKFAARLDDLLNLIPARLTALLIVMASWIQGRDAWQAWQIMMRDHGQTQSPNAGWTMSATAGALGVQLEKVDHYRLGDNSYPLSPATIDASLQILSLLAVTWSLVCLSVEVVHFVLAS